MNKPHSKGIQILRLVTVVFATAMIGGYADVAHRRSQKAQQSTRGNLVPVPEAQTMMSGSKSGIIQGDVVTLTLERLAPVQTPNLSIENGQVGPVGQNADSASSLGNLAPGSKVLVPVIPADQSLFQLRPPTSTPSLVPTP